jgi:DNA-nicking Smr family endonuclease
MSPTDDGGDDDREDDDRVGERGLRPREPGAGGPGPAQGPDEDAAFAEAMRGAHPLAPGRARVTGAAPPAPPRRTPAAAPVSPFIVEQTGDGIAGRARDVAAKLLRELRGGAHAIDARLDVHGRGRADALRALERFVVAARSRGARGLLVIHGRGHGSDAGGPVLRPAVWEWLATAAAEQCGVMAFASARPRDGGDGATMIWLRRTERP